MLRTAVPALLVLAACDPGDATPIGTTLDDGQVMVGEVTTQELVLEGAFGTVAVPLDDVGMVLPVEGRTLGDSSGHVTVWLRNGSELRGEWAEPELEMGIEVGGGTVPIQIPADRLQALQLQATEHWPEDGLYRVRTSWGDDFLVDPAATRIEIENELGTFAPFLTECRSVGPISDPTGDWRIELQTGTVLIGPLKTAEIAFALPMGPEEIVVPVESLVALERGVWGYGTNAPPTAAAPEAAMPAPAPAPRSSAKPGLSSSQGWFENTSYEDAKRR